MWAPFQLRAVLAVSILLFIISPTISADVYVNHFAVHVTGGHEQASIVAKETGMKNLGQIGSLEDRYLFEFPHRHRRSVSRSLLHHHSLETHEKVVSFQQEVAKSRQKRYFQPTQMPEGVTDWDLIDPYWPKQWYLHGGATGGFDMNVLEAWRKGYTGKDVVVSILDDGLEKNHPDLIRNYDPYASYDVNSRDNDPTPRYTFTNENRHGTRCGGEVAAEANNTYCGVGVAPDSRIGGVRMLDGAVTDSVEAAALSFNRSHIDIYCVAWGPDDDGRTVDGPGTLTRTALEEGTLKGRGGKGSIYVWASGNGGRYSDSCSCDGYANSIYILTVSSVSQKGRTPWYLEECSSTLASTYSSGTVSEGMITTTDLREACTNKHTGTSASAPLAAGVIALVLEANPDLTWRDVQYITVMTARSHPMSDGHWLTNGVGRKVSPQFGYGLMDASAMVDLALVWNNVPPKQECVLDSTVKDEYFSDSAVYRTTLHSDGCGRKQSEVNFLEHVQFRLSLTAQRRGNVVIYLTSSQGTRSKILSHRPRDILSGAFNDWTFMSVQFWGENPTGNWTLEIETIKMPSNSRSWSSRGVLLEWSLILHGTKDQPVRLKNETQKSSREPHSSTTTTIAPSMTTRRIVASPRPVEPTTELENSGSGRKDKQFCHAQCDGGCSGPAASDCFSCKLFRIANTMECVESCPGGSYASQSTCLPCDTSCDTCSGPTPCQCLSCKPGLFFDEELNMCYAQCRPGDYYENRGQNQTLPLA